jgi:hypothetical protein
MREYLLKVALYGICLRHIGTHAYTAMLHNAGVFTSRLWLWKVTGILAAPGTSAIHLKLQTLLKILHAIHWNFSI